MRLGIDLGGTKTEIIALDDDGREIYRRRVPTPSENYRAIVEVIAELVHSAESEQGGRGTVGVGLPGTVSAHTGLVKNSNTNVINGQAIDWDLGELLGREVRCMNDANCLALSEAIDGAGSGAELVFAVILGTGCGAGLAWNGKPWAGRNLVAGEWGHNPLPWMSSEEYPGPACWCGRSSCIERWISGTAFADDYERFSDRPDGVRLDGRQIVELARSGDEGARLCLERYGNRLARSLAHVINVLDPDVIVLGGGMSNVEELYEIVPGQLSSYVFGGEVGTPILRNHHGDSSGVRGAAWLWPPHRD